MKRAFLAAGAFALTALFLPAIGAAAPAKDAAKEPMWNLGELYASPAAWVTAHDKLAADIAKLDSYKGTLGKSASSMLTALNAISRAKQDLYKLYTYASLKGDEDVRIAKNQERQQSAAALLTAYGEKTAWLTPEILAVGADKIKKFEGQSPDLAKRFSFSLENTLRAKPHTLGLEAEGVLASAGTVLSQPNNIYAVLANGEVPFPTVTLSDGTKVRLDQSAYSKYRQAPNRADRKKVFDAFWGTWKKYEGTFGQTLATQVMGEVFNAKVRHFPNALSAALFDDNMPEGVYRQLVKQANDSLPTFHRYLKLRKKLLGIKGELQYYDIYPSMFKLKTPLTFTVPESEKIALGKL